MIISPKDVQKFGRDIMGVRRGNKSEKRMEKEFRKHYGSSPLDIATCWFDLCYYDEELLSPKEKTMKGFRRFLAAQYWLWARPKNVDIFSSRFGVCKDYLQGKELWKWIDRIAGLAEKKIKWDHFLDQDAAIFGVSTDGVDFPMWEVKHEEFPVNTRAMSHKFRSCGAKYIIVLSVFRSKCLFISGPHLGGKGDLDIFKECGLLQKMQDSGKKCIADRGFRSKYANERSCFAYPDLMDSRELHNFKSRARCHQETFNKRLKHFACLSSTFKNGFVKHGIALRAVAVMVQYQMDHGSPLFSV